MWTVIVAVTIGALLVLIYMLSYLTSPTRMKLRGAHVLITGGSLGIGKSIAVEVARRGANVTLLARNQARLAEAKAEVENNFEDAKTQKVLCVSADVSKDHATLEKVVAQAEEKLGPVDMLINCAGISVNGKFEDIPIEEFQRLMNVNYIGAVYTTRAVIRGMKARKRGRIVLVSSQAGQLGVFGYSAYSPTKFALRGLAECLQMELKPYNIRVTLSFPPDTDTPGFNEENITKIRETKIISETSGLFQPDYVARKLVNDMVKGNFFSYVGLDGYMLSSLTCGMSPVTSIVEAAQQVLTVGVFRAVSLFYLENFDRIIQRCKDEDDQKAAIQRDVSKTNVKVN